MTVIISSTARINSVRMKEQSSAPSTPSAGYGNIYEKTDGELYFIDDAGISVQMTAASIFSVKSYGATGDGVADDTAAINLAIAALNTATRGVLYFPAGSYLCSAGLTAITANCIVMGDGQNSWANTVTGSNVICSSATAVLFTTNALKVTFRNIALTNSNATPSAGAGISITHATLHPNVDFDSISVYGFYINVDVQVGSGWVMNNCHLTTPVLYGLKIRNTVNVDAGGWSITNTSILSGVRNATSGIRIESSGGGKILNCRIGAEAGGFQFANGIDLTTTINTAILQVANCTIENVSGDGFHVVTSGGGANWDLMSLVNVEFGLYSNTTGLPINISCGTLGDIEALTIVGCTFEGGPATNAISLTKVTNARISSCAIHSGAYTTLLTTSGCTSIYQGVLAVSTTYTDNEIARYDGTTGAIIQTSAGATIGDTGTMNLPSGQTYNVNGANHHTDALLVVTDVTTNNASTSAHGFLKKLDNDNSHFMDGTGAWTVPSAGAAVGGNDGGAVLDVNSAEVGNVGVGEDNLITYSVPAGMLNTDNQFLHFTASGQFAATVNNKRVRAYFGSTALFDSGALVITAASDWMMEGWIIRTGAATQEAYVDFTSSDPLVPGDTQYSAPTETLSGAITLKLTGEATSNNDVVNKTLIVEKLSGGAAGNDGWVDASLYTWVYASATTFTIAGVDLTTTFVKGTKLKWTQTTVKYGVVASSAFSTNTTVTIITTGDYTVANAVISANYTSSDSTPRGYPTWFNWTPTFTGFSADPAGGVYRWASLGGNALMVNIAQANTGTSNANTFTISAPVAAITISNQQWGTASRVTDNSTVSTTPGLFRILSAGTTFGLFKDISGAVWTTSNGKNCISAQLTYEF